MRTNPAINVNWTSLEGWTPFIEACGNGHYDIASLLLALPGVDLNWRDKAGRTAFFWACINRNTSIIHLLLSDPRVDVAVLNSDGRSPLYWVASDEKGFEIIKYWIASGKELKFGEGEGAAQIMRETESWYPADIRESRQAVATLLEKFKEDPDGTRFRVRMELGYFIDLAAATFAVVVFVSDGLLDLPRKVQDTTPASRFFRIACELPLELQMVLCYRVVGSSQEIIAGKDSETAFRKLATVLRP